MFGLAGEENNHPFEEEKQQEVAVTSDATLEVVRVGGYGGGGEYPDLLQENELGQPGSGE